LEVREIVKHNLNSNENLTVEQGRKALGMEP
jgi:hypothetical protein